MASKNVCTWASVAVAPVIEMVSCRVISELPETPFRAFCAAPETFSPSKVPSWSFVRDTVIVLMVSDSASETLALLVIATAPPPSLNDDDLLLPATIVSKSITGAVFAAVIVAPTLKV